MSGGQQPDEERGGIAPLRILLVLCVCVASSTWLLWPALDMGLHYDDYFHLSVVRNEGLLPNDGPTEMYTLARSAGEGPWRMGPVQGDYLPWWHDRELVIRFFRPLAALSYYFDCWLFGVDPRVLHLSSLIWFAAVVCGAVFLFAELARIAGRGVPTVLVAGLFFALSSERVGNAAWLFGRYTLVSVFFCPLVLLAYHRWRSRSQRRDLIRALAFLALGLLASETPVALFGFLVAYELCLARDYLFGHVRALAPFLLLLMGFGACYAAAGFGVKHSLWYLDPLGDPGRFVGEGLGGNFPALLMRLLFPAALEPEWAEHTIGPLVVRLWESRGWQVLEPGSAMALLFGAGPMLLLLALWLHARGDRTVRFALLGSVLSLVPLAAAPSPPRVLLLPSLGIAWVLAAFVADGMSQFRRPLCLFRLRRLVWAALALVLLWGLWHEPGIARFRIARSARAAHSILERALALEVPEGDAAQGVRVVLVTSPSPAESIYTPFVRLQQGRGWPEGIWGLSVCDGDHVLERTGERTFRLSLAGELAPGGFLRPDAIEVFRQDAWLPAGTSLQLGALVVTVGPGDEAGRVRELDVELDRPLDDPNVWLMAWGAGRWERLRPPGTGDRLLVTTRQASR